MTVRLLSSRNRGGLEIGRLSGDELLQLLRTPIKVLADCALPNDRDPPAECGQCPSLFQVPLTVALDLVAPEVRVGARKLEIPASLVPMPEAAVHENHRVVLLDDNIGTTWQTSVVQAKPEPSSKKGLAHQDFRLRVLPADALHHAGTGRAVDDIHHQETPEKPQR